MQGDSWFKIGNLSATQLEGLAEGLQRGVEQRISQGDFKAGDVSYLKQHRLALLDQTLAVDDLVLERLRYLAKAWDVKLERPNFSSHRRWIGPIIVAAKRLMFRILASCLKEQIQRQRDFNATSLELLTILAGRGGD